MLKRAARLVAVGLVLSLALVGCARQGSDRPNVKGNTGIDVSLRLEPGYVISDPTALVDVLVTGAWSVRDGYEPNTSITFSFIVPAGDTFHIRQALFDAGWESEPPNVPTTEDGYSHGSVWLSAPEAEQGVLNLERLGSWPADPPTVPDGAGDPK